MIISKHKLKNFLAEKITYNLLQASEKDVYSIIRYDGIKGFEQYNDEELYNLLKEIIPEFDLTECNKVDNNNFYLEIKNDHKNNINDIEVDIKRIIQMKMLA